MKDFLCRVGVPVDSLLRMASSLLRREVTQSLEADWQTTCSLSDMATVEQLDQFLIKYMDCVWSSCAEEIIARVMSLQGDLHRFQYLPSPGRGQ